MNNVFASIQNPVVVADGAGSTGVSFNAIWVGGTGDIAISYDAGLTFVVFPAAAAGAAAALSGTILGTLAQGTTATDLVLGTWGP